MFLTGFLTAGVSFAVYLYGLRTETEELARTFAFAVLVFAELLRSFGCRSETKPVWRIPLLSNFNLLLIVSLSFGLQVWSHHNETLGRFLKTSVMAFSDCLILLIVSGIPLAVLEVLKYLRNLRRDLSSSHEQVQGASDA